MKLTSILLAAGLLAASITSAQTVQLIKPGPAVRPAAASAQVDQEALAARTLESDNRKLRLENERLRRENQALSVRVKNFSVLGGSEVHA